MRSQRRRECMRGDAAYIRKVRSRFCRSLRRWANEAVDPVLFRERVRQIGEAMVKHGLLAVQSGKSTASWSVLSNWARQDGISWWAFRKRDIRHEVAAKMTKDFHFWLQTRERTA